MQNVLLKHGKELPGPDRMYLNADSIIFVEPVSTDPKVAQLIQKRISRSSLDDNARASRHEAASR